MARLEPGDDDLFDEALGRRGGDGSVEMDQTHRLDAEQVHLADLAAQRRQLEGRRIGLEIAPRMRLERHRGQRRIHVGGDATSRREACRDAGR